MTALPIGNFIPKKGKRACKENHIKGHTDDNPTNGMGMEQNIVDTVSHGLNDRVDLISKIEHDSEHYAGQ
jgi:hypothetical protein